MRPPAARRRALHGLTAGLALLPACGGPSAERPLPAAAVPEAKVDLAPLPAWRPPALPAGTFRHTYDLSLLPLPRDLTLRQISSHDRGGGNEHDGFDGLYSFLYKEKGPGGADRLVLFDEKGPGAVVRLWSANPDEKSTIHFFFDGESAPRLSGPFPGLFTGAVAPLAPLLSNRKSGGWVSYHPLSYAKSLKIAVDGPVYFLHIEHVRFVDGTPVRTFDPAADDATGHALAQAAWNDPLTSRSAPYGPLHGDGGAAVLQPHERRTLFERTGAGAVTGLSLWPRAERDAQLRRAVLRLYWDGEAVPSVEAPLCDFFGSGFGEADVRSLPVGMVDGMFYCRFPMPFGASARLEIENGDGRAALPLRWQVSTTNAAPPDALRFHAKWRRETTEAGKPFVILDAAGRGHYAGVVLSMQDHPGSINFLEGDEQMFVDGESYPSVHGTGTEDYFNSGWYFNEGAYTFPMHGCTVKDEPAGRISAYRFHIADPVPFRRRLRVQIEHGGTNDKPGVEYAGVAYWYQTEPHAEFAPPLVASEMSLPRASLPALSDAVQAEAAAATRGGEVVDAEAVSDNWTGGKVVVRRAAGPGEAIEQDLDVPEGALYRVRPHLVKGPAQGIVRISLDGRPLGGPVDAYARSTHPAVAVELAGRVPIGKGRHTFRLEVTGRNPAAAGFGVGIDAWQFVFDAPFVSEWRVIGPFPNEGCKGWDTAYPPETEIRLDATYAGAAGREVGWRVLRADAGGKMDFNAHLTPNDGVVAYALAWAHCDEDVEVRGLLGSDDGAKVWLNGALVHSNHAHRPETVDEDRFPLKLKKGANAVLIKIDEGKLDWQFHFRTTDPQGRIRWSATPE